MLKNFVRNSAYALKKESKTREFEFPIAFFAEWKDVHSFKSYTSSKISVKYIKFCVQAKKQAFDMYQFVYKNYRVFYAPL